MIQRRPASQAANSKEKRPGVGSDGAQLAEDPEGIFPMGCWAQGSSLVLRKKVLWSGRTQRTSSQGCWGKRAGGKLESCLGILGTTASSPHSSPYPHWLSCCQVRKTGSEGGKSHILGALGERSSPGETPGLAGRNHQALNLGRGLSLEASRGRLSSRESMFWHPRAQTGGQTGRQLSLPLCFDLLDRNTEGAPLH